MLKTNYQDAIAPEGKKTYRLTPTQGVNDTGFACEIVDETAYLRAGDQFGAADINATNAAVNAAQNRADAAQNRADAAYSVGATAQASANTAQGKADAALPKAGGTMTGWLNWLNATAGLAWTTANGAKFMLRPYAPGNLFQLTLTPNGGPEASVLSVDTAGGILLGNGRNGIAFRVGSSDGSPYMASASQQRFISVTDERITTQGDVFPNIDNAYDMGGAPRRWRNIYALNGTIQTSDSNSKTDIADLTDVACAFMLDLTPVSYKMVEGTSGRTHWGFIAQDVETAMQAHGIRLTDFASVCISKDENGNDIYGMRYEELIAPMLKLCQKQQAQINALAQRLTALEQKGVS